MQTFIHPTEGVTPRWNAVRSPGTVTLFENDEDGVRQELTIAADELPDVLSALQHIAAEVLPEADQPA